ncbi:MAG: HAD family hydrolase [Candidatus Woesearchaeota archaeon]
MIKAIIFDMDGVLVDSMKYHIYSWKKSFENEGLKSDETELSLFEGMSFKETIKRISKHNNKEISVEVQRKIHEDKRKILSEVFKLEIYEEIVEILKFLEEKGLRLGVVTGSNREFATKIIEDNFKEMFEVVVTGDDTKLGKPHPEPYNKAKEKLGLKSDEILVVENAPLGITSAKAAGLKVIAIETTLEKKHLKEANKVLKDHTELLRYFKDLI